MAELISFAYRPAMSTGVILYFFAMLSLSTASLGWSGAVGDSIENLNNKIHDLYEKGRFLEAHPLAERLLELAEASHEPQEISTALNNLADIERILGQYDSARLLYERALSIEENLGPNSPGHAMVLGNLAEVYRNLGSYKKAESSHAKALKIEKQTLEANDPNLAKHMENFAALYRDLGRLEQAMMLQRRALAIIKKAYGEHDRETAISLMNLADLNAQLGDYARAESLYREAIEIERKVNSNTPDFASAIAKLADLYRSIGQDVKAESLYRESLKIRERSQGPDHPDVASTQDALAILLKDKRHYSEAKQLLDKSYSSRKKHQANGTNPDLAFSLINLADLYQARNEPKRASSLLIRAMDVIKKTSGIISPDYALCLSNLGTINYTVGDYSKAEQLLYQAYDTLSKLYGPKHAEVGQALRNLAAISAARGKYEEAAVQFNESFKIQDEVILNVFGFSAEQQKLQFLSLIEGSYQAFLSLINGKLKGNPEMVKNAFQMILRRKGIVLDAEFKASQLKIRDPQLVNLRSEIAALLSSSSGMTNMAYQRKLGGLVKKSNAREEQLGKLVKTRYPTGVTIEDIQRQIANDAILLEFVKIEDFDFSKGVWTDSWRYLCFVVIYGRDPLLVDLGDANQIDKQIRKTLHLLRYENSSKATQGLEDLYKLIIAPMNEFLEMAKEVIISPDGMLNVTPFAALVTADKKHLIEQPYVITYINTAREIIGGTEKDNIEARIELLLLADPDYGGISGSLNSSRQLRKRSLKDAYGINVNFIPLPNTKFEAETISAMFVSQPERKIILMGGEATETAIRTSPPSRIVHLATHGFFLSGQQPGTNKEVISSQNVLKKSGLALAGANLPSRFGTYDDGILTALEISGIDLSATDLVVLSACDTGVGEIYDSEGVFGLRRAFSIGGAKVLVMSLWPVSDEITAHQMKIFYDKLRDRLTPAQALKESQVATIKLLKERYGLAPPRLWAPFIVQGWVH